MLIDFKEYPFDYPHTSIDGFENLKTYPNILELPQRIIGLAQDLNESLRVVPVITDIFTAELYGGWIYDRISQMDPQGDFNLYVSLANFNAAEIEETKDYSLTVCKPAANYLCRTVFWKQTHMWLSIPQIDEERFFGVFKTHLTNPEIFDYDNLIHLTMIVKDAGDLFEEVLQTYLPHIDRWTILDTGSTDNTINTIQRVLGSSKRGNLYQEPFQDFATSRNRCLELAGKSCVFNIMLDDTYKMTGAWRKTLQLVRTDQTSDSFSSFIIEGDIKYISNRILKPIRGLKYIYKIHEVVQENVNYIIPEKYFYITDLRNSYMDERTRNRNYRDLEVLKQCISEDPTESRYIYYLAQTHRVLGNKEQALNEYIHRVHFPNKGFFKERADACFEIIKYGLFDSLLSLEEVMFYVNLAGKIDPSRPEPWYFLAVYYFQNQNITEAFEMFKKVIQIGYPHDAQFNTMPCYYFRYTPDFMMTLCYHFKEWKLGGQVCKLYLDNNPHTPKIVSWKKIFDMIQTLPKPTEINVKFPEKPIFCIIADGNWNKWSGKSIESEGLGGSETFIVEIARHIDSRFQVVVFCNTDSPDIHEGVEYKPIAECFAFMQGFIIHTCLISRFSEYVFCAVHTNVENIYTIAHDIDFSFSLLPNTKKIKGLFGLTEFHSKKLTIDYPSFNVETFGYGIDPRFLESEKIHSEEINFIYSSGPNRGLLQLLEMWPRIKTFAPTARLTVCSDLENIWVKSVYSKGIETIKQLLKQDGITFRGWVSKSQLLEEWRRADVWFYPCIFEETFCLTALEAAATRTLAITNDLGSLPEVVGERGIIIPGSPETKEWQERALENLFSILQDKEKREKLIAENFNWARERTWKSRAETFAEKYLFKEPFLEYRNMFNWTNDILPGSFNLISDLLKQVPRNAKILEVGVYSGTSVIGMLKQLGKEATAHVIDFWKDYKEGNSYLYCKSNKIFDSFIRNIIRSDLAGRISIFIGTSLDGLIDALRAKKTFDLIHVDASHTLEDCYLDSMLAWKLLKPGGIFLFDDYEFHGQKSRELVENIVDKVGAQIIFKGNNRLACRRGES